MARPSASTRDPVSTGVTIALYILAFGMVVMLIRDARPVAVPVLTAVFLSVLGWPLMRWLTDHRVPSGIAAILVVLAMLGALALTGVILTTSLQEFSQRIPLYQQRFDRQLNAIFGNDETVITVRDLFESVDARAAMNFITGLITDILGVLGNTFVILIIVAFMLIEATAFPERLEAAFGPSEERDTAIADFQNSLVRYAGLKTLICFATGVAVAFFTALASVDVPLLLGFLAFVLNYIPNIGSWLAAIPALLLTFIVWGPQWMVVVGVGYLALNVAISNVIEPRVMGRGLGLSPLVVFVALMFFGWMLGPVGVVLAIPLVMTVRLALRSYPATRHFTYLFGPVEEQPNTADTAET